ncbi:GTP-binding protein [Kutzneria viridogrisea]|uniref:G3E family GTPase n=1 Tax=Kutzneria viridogrisea TaxID=47990 RepID=A0ABR6BAK9_9PSEU|nr:G3E family GTPase [Kutzneria viridogrisea]
MPSQIPVILVAGFLGSGKTTLLNHLLTNRSGTRVGVVVNDFGSVNIDALLVAGQVDSMVSLSNGCMCCVADASELDDMLGRLAEPSARIDVIVVEASGLAEPQSVIRMVLASSHERVRYGGLVQLVDGAEFESTLDTHPELAKHLRYADLVVLNKEDRLDEEEREVVLALVEQLAPGTPVITTAHGRIDPGLLFDAKPEDTTVARQLSFEELLRHDHHLHSAYQGVTFRSPHPFDPALLMAFLDDRPAGLYRAKGFVHFAHPEHRQKFTVHAVGNYLSFERGRWRAGEARETQLVLIGTGLDEAAITERLTACLDPSGDADPAAIFRVLRHC